jgi:hypothetical protein
LILRNFPQLTSCASESRNFWIYASSSQLPVIASNKRH